MVKNGNGGGGLLLSLSSNLHKNHGGDHHG